MTRRELLMAGTGLTLVITAPIALAQPPRRVARVGILNYAGAEDARVREFRNGLRVVGYVEGQNLAVTYPSAPPACRYPLESR